MIEELMLLANRKVAEKLVAAYPNTSLLRCHPCPTSR